MSQGLAQKARMLAGGCLLLLSGCASWQRPAIDATAGLYDQATLRYRIDAARLGTPMVAARVQAQQVSYDAIPTAPIAGQCVGTLLIEYPHPEAQPGMARATVEITAAEARLPATAGAAGWWRRFRERATRRGLEAETHETWVLDIPRGQLDQVVERLNQAGYFGQQPEVAGGIDLEIELSGSKVAKAWTQMPELDAMVTRVRGQGQLVNYQRPATGAKWGTLDKLLAARAAEERRIGSHWPTAPVAPLIARAPAGAWPTTSAPPAIAASPPIVAVQPVAYFAPIAVPTLPAPTQPEIVPLPPVGRAVSSPPVVPTNLPPETPLSALPPAGNVARLPSPPAAIWR